MRLVDKRRYDISPWNTLSRDASPWRIITVRSQYCWQLSR